MDDLRGPSGWSAWPGALWSRLNPVGTGPSDRLGGKVAQAMQVPGAQRDRHTAGINVPEDPNEAMGRLEQAFRLHFASEDIVRKIKDAVKAKQLPRTTPAALVEQALEKGIITQDEAALLKEAEAARSDYIQVDAFTLADYMKTAVYADPEAATEPEMASPEPDRQDKSVIGVM